MIEEGDGLNKMDKKKKKKSYTYLKQRINSRGRLLHLRFTVRSLGSV